MQIMAINSYRSYTEVARARGFEPRSKVLETSILPLNYARINQKVKK